MFSHTYTHLAGSNESGTRVWCVCDEKFWSIQTPEQTISKRDNTWIFQDCKHLVSCILQCAIRDHLDIYVANWSTLNLRPHSAERGGTFLQKQSSTEMLNRWPGNVWFFCHVWMMDNYTQPMSECFVITLKVFIFNRWQMRKFSNI